MAAAHPPNLSRGGRMSTGSERGAIAGAVIGGLLAAPTGGMSLFMGMSLGMSAGSIVGAYADPTRVHGPRLGDAQAQTSSVGGMIPFGYGRFVTAGNVIWCDALKEHENRHRHGKQKDITESYTRSYAIGICEGPIRGFVWIKRNGKKVYSGNWETASTEEKLAYHAFEQRCILYTGTEDQQPDATIVAVEGMGNVSAFRGLAYLVVPNDDLTESAGAIPQYEFCVDATLPDLVVSSPPYPYDMVADGIRALPVRVSGQLRQMRPRLNDAVAIRGYTRVSGTLTTRIHHAALQDAVQARGYTRVSGTLTTGMHHARPSDAVQFQAASRVSGSLS